MSFTGSVEIMGKDHGGERRKKGFKFRSRKTLDAFVRNFAMEYPNEPLTALGYNVLIPSLKPPPRPCSHHRCDRDSVIQITPKWWDCAEHAAKLSAMITRALQEGRDPKVDPQAGDKLGRMTGEGMTWRTVDARQGDVVVYTGGKAFQRAISLSTWTNWARHPGTVVA